MFKVYVNLETEVAQALARLAYDENRDIRGQVTFLIRRELQWRGLLPAPGSAIPQERAASQEREIAREK